MAPLDNSGQPPIGPTGPRGPRGPTEGDQKPSLRKTVKQFAKALAKFAATAFIRSQVDVDLKDITENISDIFSDLEAEREEVEDADGEEKIDQ